jgi:hypothetical protein
MGKELWVGLVELKLIKRGPGEPAGAFTNIVTWASNSEGFRERAETVAATIDRYVVSVEGAEPIEHRRVRQGLTEEIEEIVGRAESNPNAIIYGAFFTYPHDEA